MVHNDIALIQLTTEIRFNDHVQAICLPESKTEKAKNFVVTGWGDTLG